MSDSDDLRFLKMYCLAFEVLDRDKFTEFTKMLKGEIMDSSEKIQKLCSKCNCVFQTSEDYDICSYCWVQSLE